MLEEEKPQLKPKPPKPQPHWITCDHCGQPSLKLSLYPIPAVARLFEVSVQTVRVWINQGFLRPRAWIKGVRLYRVIPAEEVLRFLDTKAPWMDQLRADSESPWNRLAFRMWSEQLRKASKGARTRREQRRKAKEGKE